MFLVALVAVEYAVAPPVLWRDVLPTTAHRWVARQPGDVRAFDCVSLNSESQSIQWLSGDRVLLATRPAGDCSEPNVSDKLAAGGYTHLLVRRDTAEERWFASHAAEGFRVAADLEDGQVLAVTATQPPIYTAAMPGFFPREHSANDTWRWMAKDAAWSITNTRLQPIVATLDVELWAFQQARSLELLLDGRLVQSVGVTRTRRAYQIGPLTVPPGDHSLHFRSAEAPAIADEILKNGDPRALSFAVGTWKWIVATDSE